MYYLYLYINILMAYVYAIKMLERKNDNKAVSI